MLLPVIRRSVQPCKQGNNRRSMSNRDAVTIVQGEIRSIPRAGDVSVSNPLAAEERIGTVSGGGYDVAGGRDAIKP